MDWFTIVKRYYDSGRYTFIQAKVFVAAGKITEAEFTSITGLEYEA